MVLNAPPAFLSALVPVVVKHLGSAYPELVTNEALITQTIAEEEKSFSSLLPRGVKYINDLLQALQQQQHGTNSSKVIPGKHGFFLYDSLGFPLDLTQLILEERGYVLDTEGFEREMDEQRKKSRANVRGSVNDGGTVFTPLELDVDQLAQLSRLQAPHTDDSYKYHRLSSGADPLPVRIVALVKNGQLITGSREVCSEWVEGMGINTIGVILDKTPFYAEAGGQVSDTGVIAGSSCELEVLHVQSYGAYCLHTCRVVSCQVQPQVGDTLAAQPDATRKNKIIPNHTMTHMLNFALRKALPGSSIDQRGSQVTEEKLRFDFTHNQPLSRDDLWNVEEIVNSSIFSEQRVHVKVMALADALKISSVRAVFGERYPDPVRVVSIGASLDEVSMHPESEQWHDYSIEFCGGNHLECSSHARRFVIVEETSIAKGIRRISAVTGHTAMHAIELGDDFEVRVRAVEVAVRDIEGGSNSAGGTCSTGDLQRCVQDIHDVQGRANALLHEIESTTISTIVKTDLRAQLESIQRTLHTCRKTFNIRLADGTIDATMKQAIFEAESGRSTAIFHVEGEAFSHSAVMKKLMQSLRDAAPDLSFALLVNDRTKITCIAVVSDRGASQLGLNASTWVGDIVKPFGGKGGGKKDFAQGSVKLSPDSGADGCSSSSAVGNMMDELGNVAMDHLKRRS
jgi:alanyl-tRNA synthetase